MLGLKTCKWIDVRNYTQWIAALGTFSMFLQVGIITGWLSPNIARLTAKDAENPLTNEQVSWLASIAVLTGFIGGFLGLISTELIGTRHTAIVALSLFTSSWIPLILADSVVCLYLSQCINGMAASMTFCCFSLFLAGVSAPKIRGTLISGTISGAPIGAIVSTIAETYLPMKISSSIYLIHSLLATMLFIWLKSSPYELSKKKKYELARTSISFYNPDDDVDSEIERVKSFVEADDFLSIKDKLRVFADPTIRKSFVLINTLFALPHVSGITTILAYMEVILIGAKFDAIKPQQFVISSHAVCALAKILTMKWIDVLGRRVILIASSIGTAMGMAGLGLHFYLLSRGVDAGSLQWLPISSILLFLIFFITGLATVPSTVLGEIFPESAKNLAAFSSIIVTSLISFGVTKAFQPMVDLVGEAYVFWIHAALCLIGVPYGLFVLPETKGKTFQQIQDELHRK